MSTDDYILVEDGRNDDDPNMGAKIHDEADSASRYALEKQGIFLQEKSEETVKAESVEDFSKELQDLSGIEILSNDEEDTLN